MEYSNKEIGEIGKLQRIILLILLINVVAYIVIKVAQDETIIGLAAIVSLISSLVSIYFVLRIARAEKKSTPWLWAALQIVPIANMICLWMLNSAASATLKSKNIKVGFFGASSTDLDALING